VRRTTRAALHLLDLESGSLSKEAEDKNLVQIKKTGFEIQNPMVKKILKKKALPITDRLSVSTLPKPSKGPKFKGTTQGVSLKYEF